LHREGKQVTGLERCQCRKARIQRNHIGCAFLVWVRLKELAAQTGRTVYQLKHGLLDDYLIQQLRHPSCRMILASVLNLRERATQRHLHVDLAGTHEIDERRLAPDRYRRAAQERRRLIANEVVAAPSLRKCVG